MHTMSLYESGDSSGKASIQDMYNGTLENQLNDKITLDKLANLIIRGGWPSNIKTEEDKIGIIPKSYIEAIIDKDIHDDKKRDKRHLRWYAVVAVKDNLIVDEIQYKIVLFEGLNFNRTIFEKIKKKYFCIIYWLNSTKSVE